MAKHTLLTRLATLAVLVLLTVPMVTCHEAAAEPTDAGQGTVEEGTKGQARVPLQTDQEAPARQTELKNAETFAFQAEVKRLMQIIINSLYTNKEIFLRELISNGSDALDKIRFLGLTNPALLGEGESAKLSIKIKADSEAGTLTISDTGIGMNKAELVKNLGTIAQSGTIDFLKKHAGADSTDTTTDLIGQFGVGFYSAFLVADRVTVSSVSAEDPDHVQYLWESDAGGEFVIAEDPRGNTIGLHGTEITLQLKQADAKKFTDVELLRETARKYSEFITFPIMLWASHEEQVPVVEEVAPEAAEEEEHEELGKKQEEEEEVKPIETKEDEEEEEEEEEKRPKTRKETVWAYDLVNSVKPIWTRSPKKIEEEEYNEFYKSISKDTQNPLAHIHFTAEGDTEFKALLYVPRAMAQSLFDPNPQSHKNSIRLYVRRVFVTGDFFEVMPPYLRFIRGVVDSDDLPINVGREHVQESKAIEAIKSKIVRKSIQMFQELFKNDTERTGRYKEFYDQYGMALKYGVVDDATNRERLSKLLLFHSTFDPANTTTFGEYVERMKKDQTQIYFLAGESLELLRSSPLLERLQRHGYEVLLLHDAPDEWAFSQLRTFDGKELVDIARDGLKLTVIDEDKHKLATEKISKFTEWLKKALEEFKLIKVIPSFKLTKTPAAVVSPQWGISANMERVMKVHNTPGNYRPSADKILEINPGHPVIKELSRRVDTAGDSEAEQAELKSAAKVIYYTALLNSGFSLDKDSGSFAGEINTLLARSLNVDPAAEVEEIPIEKEPPTPEAEAEQPQEDEAEQSEQPTDKPEL
jgi:heat shock protein beta